MVVEVVWLDGFDLDDGVVFEDYFFFNSILYGFDFDFMFFDFGSLCGSVDEFIFDYFEFVLY